MDDRILISTTNVVSAKRKVLGISIGSQLLQEQIRFIAFFDEIVE